MRQLLIRYMDRWAPLLIAVITLFLVVGFRQENLTKDVQVRERVAKLEGIVSERDRTIFQLANDTRSYQAYLMVLQRKMIEHGIQVPDAPKPSTRQGD